MRNARETSGGLGGEGQGASVILVGDDAENSEGVASDFAWHRAGRRVAERALRRTGHGGVDG